jgi:hypothetical protein
MTFVKRIGGAAALAMLVGSGLSAPPAQAAYIVTLAQVGSNVVSTGSGTIDLAGLSFFGSDDTATALMDPGGGAIVTGPASPEAADIYTGSAGPASFGSGSLTLASSGSGDTVAIDVNLLFVPPGYVSGSPLSDNSTFDNQTFGSLGVTPGVYVWTWGDAADDSFTLDIIAAAAVPEPSSLLLGIALVALLIVRMSRRVILGPE